MTPDQKIIKMLEKELRTLRIALNVAKGEIRALKKDNKELTDYIRDDLSRNNNANKT